MTPTRGAPDGWLRGCTTDGCAADGAPLSESLMQQEQKHAGFGPSRAGVSRPEARWMSSYRLITVFTARTVANVPYPIWRRFQLRDDRWRPRLRASGICGVLRWNQISLKEEHRYGRTWVRRWWRRQDGYPKSVYYTLPTCLFTRQLRL